MLVTLRDQRFNTWKTIARGEPSLCLAWPMKLPSQTGCKGEAISVRPELVTMLGVDVSPSKR